MDQSTEYSENNKAGQLYYKDAYEFTKWLENESGLSSLTSLNAVDENGNQIATKSNPTETEKSFNSNQQIFKENDGGISIEDPNSNFNQQRLLVIRYAIDKNLSIALANYNNYSDVITDFRMPELKEDEWDKILNNVSVISFLQGLSIGGKVYNGYSIVVNDKTEEVVNTDSIYLITNDGTYHRATEENLGSNSIGNGLANVPAYLNTDFERKAIISVNDGTTSYFFPHEKINGTTTIASYDSIITQNKVDDLSQSGNNIYRYMKEKANTTVASKYFTALGRERWNMYKTNNDYEKLREELKN